MQGLSFFYFLAATASCVQLFLKSLGCPASDNWPSVDLKGQDIHHFIVMVYNVYREMRKVVTFLFSNKVMTYYQTKTKSLQSGLSMSGPH